MYISIFCICFSVSYVCSSMFYGLFFFGLFIGFVYVCCRGGQPTQSTTLQNYPHRPVSDSRSVELNASILFNPL